MRVREVRVFLREIRIMARKSYAPRDSGGGALTSMRARTECLLFRFVGASANNECVRQSMPTVVTHRLRINSMGTHGI